MYHRVRIFGATFLTALYFFAVIAITGLPARTDPGIHHVDGQKPYLSAISTGLFLHTTHSESTVNGYGNLPVLYFKYLPDNLWAISPSFEQLFEVKLTRYCYISINFLVPHSHTNIIFPFHYFW